MRHCADCNKQDGLYYDITQACHCVDSRGFPLAETQHDPTQHDIGCHRLRHIVTPYRNRLRRYRSQDDLARDKGGNLILPDEFTYLRRNGFTPFRHSEYLWAEKSLCRPCIIQWEQRQDLRKDYESRCAALQTDLKNPYEYESAICF